MDFCSLWHDLRPLYFCLFYTKLRNSVSVGLSLLSLRIILIVLCCPWFDRQVMHRVLSLTNVEGSLNLSPGTSIIDSIKTFCSVNSPFLSSPFFFSYPFIYLTFSSPETSTVGREEDLVRMKGGPMIRVLDEGDTTRGTTGSLYTDEDGSRRGLVFGPHRGT